MTAATGETKPAAGAGLARSERFRNETPRPPRATRPRTRRARAEGDAGAHSTGATTETTLHEPREASASLLTTRARGHRGRRREARTNHRRGLAARSRKADPNRQGPRSGPQTKRDQASGAQRLRPTEQTRPARFMTAPNERAALAATAAAPRNDRENRQTTRGRGVRVRECDLCTRSLKVNGRAAATPQRDELEAGPGHGPCPTTRRFARRLGRRAKNQTNAISKARDRSGPALYKFSSRTCATRPRQRNLATATTKRRPPPWSQRQRLASRALLFQRRGADTGLDWAAVTSVHVKICTLPKKALVGTKLQGPNEIVFRLGTVLRVVPHPVAVF